MLFYTEVVCWVKFFKKSTDEKIYFIRYPLVFNRKLPKGLSFIAFHSLICIRNGVNTVEMIFLKTISLKLPFWWVLFYTFVCQFSFKFTRKGALSSKSEQFEFLHSLAITWIGNTKNKVIVLPPGISVVIWVHFFLTFMYQKYKTF